MNHQEARRIFSEKISDMTIRIADPAIRKDHVKVWKTIIELYETAIAALAMMPEYEKLKERDRAKKPDIETSFYPDGSFEDSWFCPACKYDFGGEDVKFCPRCGQRIDWTEEEDYEN